MGAPPDILFTFNLKEIARLCRVSVKTARRWRQGHSVPPAGAIMILSGDLGNLDPVWRGWRVFRGKLISPEGWEIPMSETRAVPLLRAQLAAYQSENRNLKADLQEALNPPLENQPEPESWSYGVG